MGVSSPAAKNPSADVTSFFKIMIGDNFSEVMFLPPKFARTVSDLTGQKIQLEDANGQKWMVTLSKYKGSMAFQKGWHAFSVEHDLKIGEFLVFNRLKQAHFLVTTYGRSGCEKLPLIKNEERNRKRKRTNEISNGKIKHFRETDSDNVNGPCSNTSAVSIPNIEVNQSTPIDMDNTSNNNDGNTKVFTTMNCGEEQFYMINRDFGVGQSQVKDSLYDLADFEMRPTKIPGTEKVVIENEKSCEENITIPNNDSELSTMEEIRVSDEVQSYQATPKVANLRKTQKSRDMGEKNNDPVTKNDSKSNNVYGPTKCSNIGSGKEHTSVSQKQQTPIKISNQSSKKKSAFGVDFSGLPKFVKPENYFCGKEVLNSVSQKQPTPIRMTDQSSKKLSTGLDFSGLAKAVKPEIYPSGMSLKVVKQEQVEIKEGAYVQGGIPGKQWIMKLDDSYYSPDEVNNHVQHPVKAEPAEMHDLAFPVTVKIPVSETSTKQPYLIFSDKSLPVFPKMKSRNNVKVVVYLRGPVSSVHMWPVLYHERFGLKALLSGWEAFRKANGIGPGDECVFGLEDKKELIFRVTVNRH